MIIIVERLVGKGFCRLQQLIVKLRSVFLKTFYVGGASFFYK